MDLFSTLLSIESLLAKSISFPPSACTNCGTHIKFYDNIPVLSYILLGGKCRECSAKISIRYPIVEILHMTIYLILYKSLGFSPLFFIALPFSSILFAISVIDFDTFTIPN